MPALACPSCLAVALAVAARGPDGAAARQRTRVLACAPPVTADDSRGQDDASARVRLHRVRPKTPVSRRPLLWTVINHAADGSAIQFNRRDAVLRNLEISFSQGRPQSRGVAAATAAVSMSSLASLLGARCLAVRRSDSDCMGCGDKRTRKGPHAIACTSEENEIRRSPRTYYFLSFFFG